MLRFLKNRKSEISKMMFIFFMILFLNITINHVQASEIDTTIQKFEFTESVEEFNSPDMGIYRPTPIQCEAVGEWRDTKIQYANGLVHLRIGLKSFTRAGNGVQDYDITKEHVEKLNQYMRSSKRSRRNSYCKVCI